MNIEYLSYFISENTPLYGNGSGIKFLKDKEIVNGDSCNTMDIKFPNHAGTHIDLPYHFNQKGKTLNDYKPSFWCFNEIHLLDISNDVTEKQIITPDLFYEIENKSLDLLLIKTGYGSHRGNNKYTLTPPGLSYQLPDFFRSNFPNLRCVGVDLISITSYANRAHGKKAHNTFLNPQKGEPIIIIEDMNLKISSKIKKVIVAPLLIDNADGTPCTVIAFTDEY